MQPTLSIVYCFAYLVVIIININPCGMRRTIFRKMLSAAGILLLLAGISACQQKNDKIRKEQIVIGVSADFDYLNPLLIQLSMSREVCTLLYPSLVKPSYDEKKRGSNLSARYG